MQYRLSTIFLVFFFVAASLALFGAWGLLVAPVFLAIAFVYRWNDSLSASLAELYAIVCILFVLAALILPALQGARECGPHHPSCTINMKLLGLGLWNYHDAHKHFPSIISCDENGKPLHSWLVSILPNIEYDHIFNQLNADEPWDSPHNVQVLGQISADEFSCPRCSKNPSVACTDYLAVIGPGTIWRRDGPVGVKDLPNPKSITLAVIEYHGSDKHWAEPWALTAEELLERMQCGKKTWISTDHPTVVNVMFADGSVRGLSADMPIAVWRKLLMGEVKSFDELDGWERISNHPPALSLFAHQSSPTPGSWPFLLSVLVWLVSLTLLFRRAHAGRKKPA